MGDGDEVLAMGDDCRVVRPAGGSRMNRPTLPGALDFEDGVDGDHGEART